MPMVRMTVQRVGIDPNRQALVILADLEERRLLPILIGLFEAQSIAMAISGEDIGRRAAGQILHPAAATGLGEFRVLLDLRQVEGQIEGCGAGLGRERRHPVDLLSGSRDGRLQFGDSVVQGL